MITTVLKNRNRNVRMSDQEVIQITPTGLASLRSQVTDGNKRLEWTMKIGVSIY